jgi:hypothetical protein
MKIFCAAAIIALMAGPVLVRPAHAQEDNHIQRYGEEDKEKTPQQLRDEKDAQKQYRGSLSNIPDKGPIDPWGSARAADTPKAAAKAPPAKPAAKVAPVKNTKTGSTAN